MDRIKSICIEEELCQSHDGSLEQILKQMIAIMFLQMTTLGYGLLLPTFVQIVLKQPATDAGVVLLPGAIVGAVFAPIGGLILDRLGAKKPIVLGLCCSFIATFCFLFFFKNLIF